MSVCLCVANDFVTRWTDMIHLYCEVSYSEGLGYVYNYFGGGEIATTLIFNITFKPSLDL